MDEYPPTILDALDNALGERPTPARTALLSTREIESLRDVLLEFSRAQSVEEAAPDAFLVGGWIGAFWSEANFRGDLADSLLYYPRLVVMDPMADFFEDRDVLPTPRPIRARRRDGQINTIEGGPAMWSRPFFWEEFREDRELLAKTVAASIERLYLLEPLIRDHVLILRNQWAVMKDRRSALEASVRHDVRSTEMQALVGRGGQFAVWDNLRGGKIQAAEGTLSADKPWELQHESFYLAKTLAVADAAGAKYVPAHQDDLELLRVKVNDARARAHPASLLAEVSRLVVPSVDAPITEAIRLRQSSENFDDWRRTISQLARTTEAADEDDLRAQVEDELVPRIRNVERELKSTSLSRVTEGVGKDFVIAGTVGVATAALTGGDPLAAVGAAGATGVLRWIERAYGRKRLSGAEAVIGALLQGPKPKRREAAP